MGLFSYLKEKILGKSTKQKDKYVVGLDKSSELCRSFKIFICPL